MIDFTAHPAVSLNQELKMFQKQRIGFLHDSNFSRSSFDRNAMNVVLIFVAFCFSVLISRTNAQEVQQASQSRVLANPADPKNKPIPSRVLDRIPAGTSVFDENNRGFTNVVLFVKGKLGAGDVAAVSDTAKYYADLFNLVYMANVTKDDKGFALDKVAVGFSTHIDKSDIVVTSDTAKKYGLSLSFIGSSVLSGNEDALKEIKLTAQDRFTAIIDAPSVMQFNGKHQKMIARYYIWVSPEDGRMGATVWLLENKNKQLSFAEDKIHYFRPGMVENRVMHVDGTQFTLGIPSAKAFAIMELPKERSFKIDDEMQQIGSQATYTPAMLEVLSQSLAKTLSQ